MDMSPLLTFISILSGVVSIVLTVYYHDVWLRFLFYNFIAIFDREIRKERREVMRQWKEGTPSLSVKIRRWIRRKHGDYMCEMHIHEWYETSEATYCKRCHSVKNRKDWFQNPDDKP